MYEEFINTENTIIAPPGSYYVSSYGRFGYIVNFLLGFVFSGFLFVPLFSSASK